METAINFQELQKMIFNFVCEFARNITAAILIDIDKNIKDNRDKKRYRLKDKIKTTVKTVYGEVSLRRRYYYDNEEQTYTITMLQSKASGGLHRQEKLGYVRYNKWSSSQCNNL